MTALQGAAAPSINDIKNQTVVKTGFYYDPVFGKVYSYTLKNGNYIYE